MQKPAAFLALYLLALAGCAKNRAASVGDAADVRGALGAATATKTDFDPASRAFRVVPLRAMTGDVEFVFGHPDSAGPFVMRIRELPGTMIPPHRHPVDEHVTVVSGTWYFATGEEYDSTALRELKTGAYAFAPAGTSMFGYSPDGAVVQVHGTGPFHIHWRDSVTVLDDLGSEKRFRFRKGDDVSTPRGPGRIRQGYASGKIIQYEIDGGAGVFMVSEHQLARR